MRLPKQSAGMIRHFTLGSYVDGTISPSYYRGRFLSWYHDLFIFNEDQMINGIHQEFVRGVVVREFP